MYLELADEELGDDDVFVLESIAEAKKNEDDRLRVTMVISLKETINSLAKILKIIEVRNKSKSASNHLSMWHDQNKGNLKMKAYSIRNRNGFSDKIG